MNGTIGERQRFNLSEACFCTAAFGSTYRKLAKLLIGDLQRFAPEKKLVIFTDKAREFEEFGNVQVYQHKKKGIYPHNERRFAIAKALELFPVCIYLDCDVRITEPVDFDFEIHPGITARSCTTYRNRYKEILNGTDTRPGALREFEVVKSMARKVELDVIDNRLMWINEFLFIVARDNGRERNFLELWGKLADFAELRGVHTAVCHPMGFAALKTGFPVRHHELPGLSFFDDRIEKERIKKGQAHPEEKKSYFEAQSKIEKVNKPDWKKVLQRILRPINYRFSWSWLVLKTVVRDFRFYHW